MGLIGLIVLVSADWTPQGNINLRNIYNITGGNWISANFFNGTLTGEVTGSMNYTKLKNYPVACPGSSAITQLDDSVTCSDLWVDVAGDVMTGGLNISGDLNVTGNVTSENLFIKQYIFAHTNRTHSLVTMSVWANLTFDQEQTDIKFGISHDITTNQNGTFTINDAGIYEITFDIDIIDTSVGASDIDVAARVIFINGTEITGSVFETDIIKQATETELSHTLLARFGAGDKIVFQFTADDVDVEVSSHRTFGVHPESASIVIKKVSNI